MSKKRPALYSAEWRKAMKSVPVPAHDPDGQFDTFARWVNKATSWIGGKNPYCADAKGRRCLLGADFMLADQEGAFPVRFWFGEGGQTAQEQRKNARLAAQGWRRGA